ncbi:MAG: exonuclease SbcCD subunit D [Dehalococcoidia bacterium]|jgi:exonuclease SbcD|nr:exonuclease SbcCD subunit D [Dehalococcoidia bacterium]
MRILHFSDVHIGVESYGSTDSDTGLSSRLTDFLATFDQVVDFAIDNRVDLVLFAGDAYKSRDPSQTHQREFAKRIARLSQADMPVFLLLGNHDLPHIASRATALDIFDTLAVPNVTIGDRLDTYPVQTRNGPLQVIALPWIRRSAFLAREETRNLTIDQINQQLQERVTNLLTWQIERLDLTIPTVLVAHVSLNTAMTSSEQSMLLGRDPIIMQSALAHPSLDYVALGHIHKHQVLSQNPHVAYSGSLERIDFGEENDDKGFCLIDLDPSRPPGRRLVDFNFNRVKARPFLTIEVKVNAQQDPTEEALKAIARRHVAGAIVRVKVAMPQEVESRLREDEVRSALSEAQFITPIARNVQRDRRTRLSSIPVEGLSPQQALRLYLEAANIPQDRANLLLSYGENIINEEMENS